MNPPTFILIDANDRELPEWIASRRAALTHGDYELRAVECPRGHTVEIRRPSSDRWSLLGWHLGAACWATPTERDAVLKALNDSAQPSCAGPVRS